MGIKRGTVLGLTGIAGALIEQQLGLIGGVLMDVFAIGPLPALGSWTLGCALGVLAGDAATALTGQEVALGRWAGIKKGLIASLVAGLGFYMSTTGLATESIGTYVETVPKLAPEDVIKIGSIWLGGVLGDFFGA